jgi:hypothetical protein
MAQLSPIGPRSNAVNDLVDYTLQIRTKTTGITLLEMVWRIVLKGLRYHPRIDSADVVGVVLDGLTSKVRRWGVPIRAENWLAAGAHCQVAAAIQAEKNNIKALEQDGIEEISLDSGWRKEGDREGRLSEEGIRSYHSHPVEYAEFAAMENGHAPSGDDLRSVYFLPSALNRLHAYPKCAFCVQAPPSRMQQETGHEPVDPLAVSRHSFQLRRWAGDEDASRTEQPADKDAPRIKQPACTGPHWSGESTGAKYQRLRNAGWRYREIAAHCGVTVGAVSSRISKLRPVEAKTEKTTHYSDGGAN